MDEAADISAARPRGEIPAEPLDVPPASCWQGREIDLAGIRRWFIRRVAQEALKELAREDQHDADDT
jgi:hypothetical protein